MMVIGLIIKCMVGEFSLGKITENMRGTIIWIKRKGMEFLVGQMEGNMKGNGRMENNMVKECTLEKI